LPDTGIHIVYDYVDPGSYIAFRLLRSWREELADPPPVSWTPLELRTPSSSLLDPQDPAWEDLSRFIEGEAREAKIPFRVPRFIPWSRKAHELALHAREEGCFDRIHEAIFRAHFEEGRDIGRVDVLVELAGEQELDPAGARTVLGVDRFLPAVEEARRSLLDRGVRGVPTVETAGRVLEGFPDAAGFLAFLRESGRPSDGRDGDAQNGS